MGGGLSPSDYRRGLLCTALGVLFLTPDALLVRLIHADSWTLLFWRGLLMSLSFSVFLGLAGLSPKNLNLKGLLAALFLALSTTCFVLSLHHTQAANTLIIVATSPLLAAVMSAVFLREVVPPITWMAILVAVGGVSLSLQDGLGRESLVGELYAAGSAVCMASHFTALRWWRSENGPLAVWAAGFLTALVALPLAPTLSVAADEIVWTALLGGLVLPLAFGLMAVGPRYLPAPEVGLLLLGETVLGPLWVWLALKEQPGRATLTGGLIVVMTLCAHSLYRRRGAKKAAATAPPPPASS